MITTGKSIEKRDGLALVTGKPLYTDDLAPKECLIIRILRSPHPFAKILSIQTEQAKKVPGVELILTWQDIERTPFTRAGQCWPELSPYDTYILDEYVRHVGDAVAIVAARDEKAANRALKMIKPQYQVLEPILDPHHSATSSVKIHPEPQAYAQLPVGYDPNTNTVAVTQWHHGDVDTILNECPVTITRTYKTQAQAQAMMETQRAFAYMDYNNRLVVTASTQIPFHARRILARALNIPTSKIRVIKPRVGGGFGAKQTVNAELYPALITWLTGKPSKMVYTRQEAFNAATSRHAMEFTVTLGATKEGKLRAIDVSGLSDTGGYGEHGSTTFGAAGSKVLELYNKVDACRFGGKVVYTNHVPGGALRGFGVTQGTFALETCINELAEILKIDPVDFRRMNMIQTGETTPLFNMHTKGAGPDPIYMDSCQLPYCVDRGAQMAQWNTRYQVPTLNTSLKRGFGMAITQQGSGLPQIDMASAILKLNDDGFFSLLLGSTDIGTGADTILAQIAAEALDIDIKHIVVYTADTDLTPFDSGAYASSTTYTTGNAVIAAAEDMKHKIIEATALFWGCEPACVVYEGQTLTNTATDEHISLAELSKKCTYNVNHTQLVASGSFVPKRPAPPYMATFAEVDVNTSTGQVFVKNLYGVVDCGTPINHMLCKIQAEGGMMQGIGLALYEEVKYTAQGRLINDTFMQYKLPSRKDYGALHVELAPGKDDSGPYGAKSIGEVVVNSVAPAIIEAIYQACGARIRELPATPEKILSALNKL